MDGGEQFFESIASSFLSKNADVEEFLREKAVQATKLNTAATYLVISYEDKKFDFLGYFTLAGALAAVKGIESVKNGMGGEGGVRSLQEYHSLIK